MATTINQSFQQLKANLEITGLQQQTVSTRQQNVRDAVTTDLTVLDTFLTGSYRRSTMIAPLKDTDIDVFVVLDASYFKQDGQASLLDKVKTTLKKTYPTTPKISRNGQAITITFTDFTVDVVPAFNRQGGGYLIADSVNGRWISTNPKKHVEIWSAANAIHQGNLVPLIKMIKGWNRQNSALFRSFHLEAMILAILTNVTISDYPSGVRFVFDKARQAVKTATLDPSGYGGNLADYLNTQQKIAGVVSRLETAYCRAVEAESLDKQGKITLAVDRWRLIFGDYFPAYG
ncbi:CBASS oligonucleotide cyclase [Undibacterium sp. RuRC25W]|uniref:CBASS oligonucleotide cyclase n=1 Tax=Undibacterium sp. RuRC25W TaxID=3413047 RepID=UPI003BF253F3